MILYVTIHAVLWSNCVLYTIDMFVKIFLCNPREKEWNQFITTGSCLNINAAQLSTGICNVVSDFIILLLPQFSIWRLKMSTREKLGISAIFAIGLL